MELIKPKIVTTGKVLSFGEYKTHLKNLQEEQLELIKALEQSTRLLEGAMRDIEILYKALEEKIGKTMVEELLSNASN